MKLHKFFGATSRAVLEQIRSQLGPDAMILANRPTADGFEITAAAGGSIAPVLAGRQPPERDDPEAARAPAARSTPEQGDAEGVKVLLSAAAQRNAQAAAPRAQEAAPPAPRSGAAAPGRPAAVVPAAPPAPEAPPAARDPQPPLPSLRPPLPPFPETHDSEHVDLALSTRDDPAPLPASWSGDDAAATAQISARLMEEVTGMRAFVEEQFAQLAWNDSLKRAPLRARLLRDLLVAGYSPTLAREIVGHLPDDFGAERGKQWLRGVLSRNLRCNAVEDEVVARGGIYALVGPTGVGKTTTTAKLAARCAVRYGASRLALLTTDSYRVGAHDQLRIYAKILGVAVHTISDRQDLQQALDSVRGKHLVLVDTVGIGQRDQRVVEQSALLAHPEVRKLLLLNAAAQGETLEEVVQAYCRPGSDDARQTAGVIVTKIDEAGRMAAALDIAIRHRLLVHYVTNGQRVPEDLAMPQAGALIDRSFRAAAKPSPYTLREDELTLLATVTGAAHA